MLVVVHTVCSHPAYFAAVQRVLGQHKLDTLDGENLILREVPPAPCAVAVTENHAAIIWLHAFTPSRTHTRECTAPQTAQKIVMETMELRDDDVDVPPSEPWLTEADLVIKPRKRNATAIRKISTFHGNAPYATTTTSISRSLCVWPPAHARKLAQM